MGWLAVVVVIVLAGLYLGRQSLRIRARTRRLLSDQLPPAVGGPAVAAARVEHLRTSLGREDACLPGFVAGATGLLSVGDREVRLDAGGSAHIPMGRIEEAVFMASFEGARSAVDGVLVRIPWRLADERLESVFRVLGKRLDAERLRREIHLRIALGTDDQVQG